MKNRMTDSNSHDHENKQGFMLFLVIGIMAVISLAALMAVSSAKLETRTSYNNYHSTRALYHAEAGVKLVKAEVERRLQTGETLSTILDNLSISPPSGIEFEVIDSFKEIVPERLFSFESVGISEDAISSVVVQFRRQPIMTIGLFGDLVFDAQNHTIIYGYDSRYVKNPTPADNNSGASIGSNGTINIKSQHFTFDGSFLLGESNGGSVASCPSCENYTKLQVGAVYYDPQGLVDGGAMSIEYGQVSGGANDNLLSLLNGGIPIINNTLNHNSSSELKLPAGDYYLEDFYMKAGSTLKIMNSNGGQVRIFLNGEFRMQPNTDIIFDDDAEPMDFQIYSVSTEEIRIQPNSSSSAFIYAPLAEVGMQPGGDFRGNIWAKEIDMQPSGNIYVDTSIADSMLQNSLEIHAWYEQQGR